MENINMLQKDEYGLYINSSNYQQCMDGIVAFEINQSK